MGRRFPWALDALHVFVLASFAVAQPVFDAIGRSPEFLLARGAHRSDVLVVVLACSVLLPAVLVAGEAAAGLLGERVRRAAHAAVVVALVALAVLPVLHRALAGAPGPALLAAAGVVGIIASTAYVRLAAVRLFTTVLAPAIVVFPAVFLFRSPVSMIVMPPRAEVVAGTPGAKAPVIVVVFDEFPTTALLGADLAIDERRYPHFAALAREGTWFRNATTVSELTEGAVAAIVTGRLPERAPLGPAVRARNLFGLLASSHDLRVFESYVRFCPPELCAEGAPERPGTRLRALVSDLGVLLLHVAAPPDMRAGLPDLSEPMLLLRDGGTAGGSGDLLRLMVGKRRHVKARISYRAEVFDRFIDAIDLPTRPTLYYLHILLPHSPYSYLPSRRLCALDAHEPLKWGSREMVVAQRYQRLLLQVGFVDTMLGRLVDRLRAKGLWDASLLVVVADHGVSHRPGDLRRVATRTNSCDILAVPLFVKAPRQRTGGISDRNAEVIDVLPTIADALGIRVPWPVDGQSLLGAEPERGRKVLTGPPWPGGQSLLESTAEVVLDPAFAKSCLADVERRLGQVGGDGWLRVGPYAELVGRPLAEVEVVAEPTATVELAYAGALAHVVPQSDFVPCMVEGVVTMDGGAAAGTPLAVAINGIVRGVTEAVGLPKARVAEFGVTVPEEAFSAGRNTVGVFVVSRHDGAVRLTPTRGASGVTYALAATEGAAELAITSSDGRSFPVRPGALAGALARAVHESPGLQPAAERGASTVVEFRGWAADVEHRRRAEMVLVFVDGRFYHAAHLGLPPPDLPTGPGGAPPPRSGFEFGVLVPLGPEGQTTEVRAFAVSRDGTATELLEQRPPEPHG